tara:strand:- start:1829 stop:2128 length:300 start_codon:yes stop_codon:yes gene_type:complete
MDKAVLIYWLLIAAIAICGWLLKILEKVIKIHESGKPMSVPEYLSEDRYRIAISVIGTFVLVVALESLGQLNYAMAAASGYVGESASRFLRNISDDRML